MGSNKFSWKRDKVAGGGKFKGGWDFGLEQLLGRKYSGRGEVADMKYDIKG